MTKKRKMSSETESTNSGNSNFQDFKRLKVDFEVINTLSKNNHPEIDITNYEIYKFLTIFESLLYSKDNQELNSVDSEDGVQDIITVVASLLKLLKENIGKLGLPAKIKLALTKLQELLNT